MEKKVGKRPTDVTAIFIDLVVRILLTGSTKHSVLQWRLVLSAFHALMLQGYQPRIVIHVHPLDRLLRDGCLLRPLGRLLLDGG